MHENKEHDPTKNEINAPIKWAETYACFMLTKPCKIE